MSEQPWMPLYVNDYWADTVDLSTEEHGCYLLMLMLAWRRKGSLPGNMEAIRRMLPPMHGRVFKRLVPMLLNRFFQRSEDGSWTQKRLEKEMKLARNFVESQRKKARKRWETHAEKNGNTAVQPSRTNGLAHAAAYAGDMPCSDAGHMPSQSQSEEISEDANLKKEPTSVGSKKPAPKGRKTKLAEGWRPSEKNIQDARVLGLSDAEIDHESAKFQDRQRMTGATYIDWDAAWRSWCRLVPRYRSSPPASSAKSWKSF